MKLLLSVLTLCVFSALLSCQKNTSDESTETSFPISTINWQIKNSGRLSDLIELAECIELDNAPEATFSSIDCIVCHGGRYFIFDKYGSNKLLVFDQQGRFVRQIGRPGRGPGEYVRLEDFSIRNDTIFAMDANGQKILVYGIDGKYVRDVRTANLDFPDAMAWLSDGFLFYRGLYDDEPFDNVVALYRTDDRADAAEPYFGYNEQSQRVSLSQPLTESDSMILFSRYLNDTVVRFDRSGHIVEGIHFDFGKRSIPASERVRLGKQGGPTSSPYAFLASTPILAGSRLCGVVYEAGERTVFVYDSLTQRTYIDREGETLPALPSNFAARDSTGLVSWLSYDVKDNFTSSLGADRIRAMLPRLEEGAVFLILYRWKHSALRQEGRDTPAPDRP